MKKYLAILFFPTLFWSCSKEDNQLLEIYYRRPGALLPMTILCPTIKHPFKESSDGIWFTVNINNPEITDKFQKAFIFLKSDKTEQNDFDTSASIIYHHNDTTDTICTNNFGQILLNGVPQQRNPELFLTIAESVTKDYNNKRLNLKHN